MGKQKNKKPKRAVSSGDVRRRHIHRGRGVHRPKGLSKTAYNSMKLYKPIRKMRELERTASPMHV